MILIVLVRLALALVSGAPEPDPVCLIDMAWVEEPRVCCNDSRDNDNDGLIDHQDPDCRGPQS